MKKVILGILLCTAMILCISGPAVAKLFIVEIDGDKVVVDFYLAEEQVWQNTQPGEPGYWPGVAPHPYEYKIWYPFLKDTIDMTLAEQMSWIEDLCHAGIKDWRIAHYWDTVPIKASIFGGMQLGLLSPNVAFNYNCDVYFPPTSCGPGGPTGYMCIYLGRTGNEDGEVTGAIVNPMMGFTFPPEPPAPINPRYEAEGTIVRTGGMADAYWTLPRTEAQDHWVCAPGGPCLYNDDLNGNWDDNTEGLMGPVDEETGVIPLGAWTVSDTMPVFYPLSRKFHTISISKVVNPGTDTIAAGTLVAVEDVTVMQDEPLSHLGPDAKINQAVEATYIKVRAKCNSRGDGRVYHISFSDGERDYTFKVGVTKDQLVDGGPLFDSTGY